MCFSPVTLKNNRIDFRPSVDKLYLTVPCGHCAACVAAKRDDWFVRLYYHFKDTLKHGCVLFPTLTFSDDFLPCISPSDTVQVNKELAKVSDYYNMPVGSIPSFDKDNLQRCIKKLRTYLLRDGVITKDLKYFITCEFGALPDHTHRQHYHCLFFLPEVVDSLEFQRYLELSWSKKVGVIRKNGSFTCSDPKFKEHYVDVVRKYFKRADCKEIFNPYGTGSVGYFAYHRSKNGSITIFRKLGYSSYSVDDYGIQRPFVENEKALKYVCKYIQKTDEYFHNVSVRNFFDYIKHEDIDNLPLLRVAVIDHIKNALPFTLSSNGLGLPFIDRFQCADSIEDANKVLDREVVPSKLSFDFTAKQFRVPRYLVDRLFNEHSTICRYDVLSESNAVVNETDKVTLNQVGYECLLKRMVLQVQNDKRLYQVLLSQDHFNHIVSIPSGCVDGVDIQSIKFLYSLIPPYIDFELLSMYRIRFKDLSTSMYCYKDLEAFSKKDFVTLYFDLSVYNLDTYNDVSDAFDAPLSNPAVMQQYLKLSTFNDLEIFDGYDVALEYLNLLSKYISRLFHSATALSHDKRDILINYLNSIKYV